MYVSSTQNIFFLDTFLLLTEYASLRISTSIVMIANRECECGRHRRVGHATGNPRVVSVYPYPYPLRVRTRFPRVCTRCGYGFLAHGYGFLRVWRSAGLAGAMKHIRYKNAEGTYTQPEEA